MRFPERRAWLGIAVAFSVGCGEEPPELSNLRCDPQSLSAAPPGPYTVQCTMDYEGKVGDITWTASSGGQVWTGGFDSLSPERWTGNYGFTMTKAEAPPVGTLLISVIADHIHGLDGPGDDTASTMITIVP